VFEQTVAGSIPVGVHVQTEQAIPLADVPDVMDPALE
jgi:hypothetical protein